jgi:CRISPR-associated protein Csm5
MKDYLTPCRVTLETVGPVFIGNGKEYNKKEYISRGADSIAIVDPEKLYQVLKNCGKDQAFEDYLLDSSDRRELGKWLIDAKINMKMVTPTVRYQLAKSDVQVEKGKNMNVLSCIKDPYGLPYVPGSSLKGMLRTTPLADEILKSDYTEERDQMEKSLRAAKSGRNVLQREIDRIESGYFRTLNLNENSPSDSVNDWMSGIIVSDSAPLSTNDLVLCQKLDHHVNQRPLNTGRALPILRECIKPRTRITFSLTINRQRSRVNAEQIQEAVQKFSEEYSKRFVRKFWEKAPIQQNHVFLGGGTGFLSKTVLYELFEGESAVRMAVEIFKKTRIPEAHHHSQDNELGIAPHMWKLTKYRGNVYQMGECVFQIEDLTKAKEEADVGNA